jgi:hypothetical protein
MYDTEWHVLYQCILIYRINKWMTEWIGGDLEGGHQIPLTKSLLVCFWTRKMGTVEPILFINTIYSGAAHHINPQLRQCDSFWNSNPFHVDLADCMTRLHCIYSLWMLQILYISMTLHFFGCMYFNLYESMWLKDMHWVRFLGWPHCLCIHIYVDFLFSKFLLKVCVLVVSCDILMKWGISMSIKLLQGWRFGRLRWLGKEG